MNITIAKIQQLKESINTKKRDVAFRKELLERDTFELELLERNLEEFELELEREANN